MPNRSTRRSFFRDATLIAGGAAGGLAGGFFPLRSGAIEPIPRNGAARFKFGLNAYSYRALLAGNPPKLTIEDFVADCARMGLDGTELTNYWFPKELSGAYLRRLKHLTFRLGLQILAVAVRNDFCEPPGAKRDQQLAYVRQWIDYAELLGAPLVRIYSGDTRRGQDPAEAHKLAVEGIQVSCDYAAEHGVFLALENHGGLTATAEGTLRIVRDVKSPWFGMNLDPGNYHSADIYADTAKLAPYAVTTHIKVVASGPDKKKVPMDFQRLAGIFTDAGYRGYIVLEYEEEEDPRVACPRYVEQLRAAFR